MVGEEVRYERSCENRKMWPWRKGLVKEEVCQEDFRGGCLRWKEMICKRSDEKVKKNCMDIW